MNVSLTIALEVGRFERARADVAVASIFEHELPLRGAAGRADWRLCGELSELAALGRLTGESGEAVLLTSRGGLGARVLIVLGLGERLNFNVGTFEEFSRDLALRSIGLRARSVALSPSGSEPSGIPLKQRISAIVRGAAAAVEEREADLYLLLVVSREEEAAAREALRSVPARGGAGRVVLRLVSADRGLRSTSAGPSNSGSSQSGSIPPQAVK